jgi:hypothetical protein
MSFCDPLSSVFSRSSSILALGPSFTYNVAFLNGFGELLMSSATIRNDEKVRSLESSSEELFMSSVTTPRNNEKALGSDP